MTEVDDLFGKRGRTLLRQWLAELPSQTAFATTRVLEQIGVGWSEGSGA